MTLRLTDEDDELLSGLAKSLGVSKQEATVRAIREVSAQRLHRDRVRELSAEARSRYTDVLRRLGE